MVNLTTGQARLRLAALMGLVTTRTSPNEVSTQYLLGGVDVATELTALISLGVLVYDWDPPYTDKPRFLPGERSPS